MTDLAADDVSNASAVFHSSSACKVCTTAGASISSASSSSRLAVSRWDRFSATRSSIDWACGIRALEFPDDQRHRYAVALSHDPDTGLRQQLPDLSRARFDSGGAGLVGTAGDYLRLRPDAPAARPARPARILGRKTVEHMTSDRLMPAPIHTTSPG